MDDRKLNVGVVPAVMTIRTREVGKAWATRSLGIALALCLSLTVGGDLSVRASAEPWSGILDPSRAIDWSHAGIPGGIPNRATICASLDPVSSAAEIDAAIASCPPEQVVFLTPGTFTLSAGLNMKSDVTLRGAGANRTKLVFTGTTPCDRGPPPYPVICLKGSFSWAGGVENSADWTAGYAKGTTVITLSNTANLRAGESFLILDQVDDTVDGGGGINIQNAMECWITGVRSVKVAPPGGPGGGRNHVWLTMTRGNEIRSNYFYGSGGQSQSYGIEWYPGSDNLVENNIFQHVTSPMLVGTGSGDVLTYNFAIDDLYTPGGGGWMQPNYAGHNGGDAMLLIEGNDGLGAGTDNIHGTHHFLTFFRNHFHAAEVPTGLTNFANPVPATHVLPPSLYLSAKPSWWGTVPWPAIGPDVAGGDILGYAGHVYKNPARRCYENAAIDPAYGSSGVRIFDPETCYATARLPLRATPGL